MQAVTTVRDVRDAKILAGRQQVFDALRNQRAERDLERQRTDVYVIVTARARVQINPVAADAHGVGEILRRDVVLRFAQRLRPRVRADVLFEDREFGFDPPALADVGILRQPVLRADNIGPQPQALPTRAAVGPWGGGLQPVEQRKAELLRALEVPRRVLGRALERISQQIIILRPVHERRVAGVSALGEILPVHDLSVMKKSLTFDRIETKVAPLKRLRMTIRQVQQLACPRRRELGHVVAPEFPLARLLDGVIRAGNVFRREADRERLHVLRLRLARGVRFAGFRLCLRAGDVFRFRHGQQLAGFRRIHEHWRRQNQIVSRFRLAHDHRFDLVTRRPGRQGFMTQQDLNFPSCHERREHLVQRRQSHARFVAELRNAPTAGIQIRPAARLGREREIALVVIADAGAQIEIAPRAAEGFDPGVFIRRHGLRGELPADPIGFLRQNDLQPIPCGRERGGATAQATTDDDQIRAEFLRARSPGDKTRRRAGLVLRQRHSRSAGGERRNGGEGFEKGTATQWLVRFHNFDPRSLTRTRKWRKLPACGRCAQK